jgi:DNA repair protein RadA/Sms
MAKQKSAYVCSACGYESPRWYGKCPTCDAWNTLEETIAPLDTAAFKPKEQRQRGGTGAQTLRIDQI